MSEHPFLGSKEKTDFTIVFIGLKSPLIRRTLGFSQLSIYSEQQMSDFGTTEINLPNKNIYSLLEPDRTLEGKTISVNGKHIFFKMSRTFF